MTGSGYSPTSAPDGRGHWRAPVAEASLRATITVPGSKSLTNRELILASLADGPSRLLSPLHSDDSARMIHALRALGVGIEFEPGDGGFGDDIVVTPVWPLRGDTEVDCGQAGTVMRFVAGLGGFARGDVTMTAHESALHRPMGAMITALRDVGVDIDDGGHWSLPFIVRGHGHTRGGEVTIDASASSQFVSGLLLAAPRFDVGLHLHHAGERLPSMPHIDMTIEALAHRGVHVERPAPGEWIVPAGAVRGKDVAIEPDLSNAAPFLAAAMVVGGSVSVTGWPAHSTQPGAMLTEILALMGAKVQRRGGALTVTGGSGIQGIDLDLSAAGELTPTIFALAAFADAPSTLHGIGHIRGHETDRIAALVSELRSLGGEADELPDGIRIVPRPLHGGTWHAHHDHRMATTGALIGLAVPGVEVDDIGTTAKTMPQFPELWQAMLVDRDDPAAEPRGDDAGIVSWLDDLDDEDEPEFDEANVRVRPNPKANRPRTKRRPAHSDARIARVLGVDRGRYTVLVDEGEEDEHTILAVRARELRKMPIVTGDRARVVGDTSGDEGTLSRIIGIEDRTSLLRRSADDTDQVERVVVANADQMLVVVAAADPEPRARLVDRYLVAALDAGIRPLLVVTKTDLADPAEFLSHFDGLDLEVFTSGREEMPLDRIGSALVGHSTVFVGHSGVGKSTLVNALVPEARRATGHVNVVTGRGRHTSSSTVSLRYVGPEGTGWVIDTPGVRSFGLGHVDPANILRAFTDLDEIAQECPRGCTHLPDAPDCAIVEAVAEGRLGEGGPARLDSLQRLLETFAKRDPATGGRDAT